MSISPPYSPHIVVGPKDQNFTIYPNSIANSAKRFKASTSPSNNFHFGPTHLSLPFPILLSFSLKQKKLSNTRVEVGWLHQGIEKSCESTSLFELPLLATKLNPFTPAPIALSLALAVERIIQIEEQVPSSSQAHRVFLLEISRIFHHLVVTQQVLNHFASQAFSSHTKLLIKLADKLKHIISYDTNNNPSWRVGGISRVFSTKEASEIQQITEALEQGFSDLQVKVKEEVFLKKRLVQLGHINKSLALSFGITGPTLKASNINDDLRISHPYFAYKTYVPKKLATNGGDIWARFTLRLEEIQCSLDLMKKIFKDYFQELLAKDKPISICDYQGFKSEQISAGLQTSFTQAPEGELAVSICSNNTPFPTRVRIRTPAFTLASAIAHILDGANIDEVIPTLLSLGISGIEVDR